MADVYFGDIATLAAVKRENAEQKGWDGHFGDGVDAFYLPENTQQSA